MFADPQSVVIDGTTTTLPRVLTGTREGLFESPNLNLSVQSSAKNGRVRTVARINATKITTDPLVSTTNVVVSDSVALTINRPSAGFSDAEVIKQVKGFIAWLTANTDANLTKLVAGEN